MRCGEQLLIRSTLLLRYEVLRGQADRTLCDGPRVHAPVVAADGVDGLSQDAQLECEQLEGPVGVGARPLVGREAHDRLVRQGALDQPGEHGLGPELDEDPEPRVVHLGDPPREVDRVAQLLHQDGLVPGRVRTVGGSRRVRVDGPVGRLEVGRPDGLTEGVHRVLHERGVERGRHRQARRGDPLGSGLGHELLDLSGGSTDDELLGSVDIADPGVGVSPHQFVHGAPGCAERRHGAGVARRGSSHRPASRTGQLEEPLLGENARGPQGREFAEAVSEETVRGEAEFAQPVVLADGERPDRRLGVLCLLKKLALLLIALAEGGRREDRARHGRPAGHVHGHAVEGFAHRGHGQSRGPPHVDVLAPLTGEQGRDLGGPGKRPAPAGDSGRIAPRLGFRSLAHHAFGTRPELLELLLRAVDEADPEVSGRNGRAVGGRGVPCEPLRQSPGVRCVPQGRAHSRCQNGRPLTGGRVLLQYAVVVRPAEPEGGDGGPSDRASGLVDPRSREHVDVDPAVLLCGRPQRLCDVDGRGQDLLVQCQRRLDDAGRARRGFGVADLRLDASDRGEFGFRGGFPDEFRERREFDAVTRLGAGSVRLEKADRRYRHAGVLVGAAQSQDLPLLLGGVDTSGPAVVGGAKASYHRVDLVAVALGVLEPAQGEHAYPITEEGPVGGFIKRPHVSRKGKCGSLGESHIGKDRVIDGTTAGHHHVLPPGRQFTHRDFDRREGTRTGGVDRAVHSAEVQPVGDAPRHHITEQPGKGRLVPFDERPCETLGDLAGIALGQADAARRVGHDRCLHPRAERDGRRQGTADAQDHARPRRLVPGRALGPRVTQQVPGDDEAEQLDDVG